MFIPAKFRLHKILIALYERRRERDRLHKAEIRALDPEKARRVMNEWRSKNRPRWREIAKKSKAKYPDKYREYARRGTAKYRLVAANKAKVYEGIKRRLKTDPMFRIMRIFTVRVASLIRKKSISTSKLIGCSRDEFRAHLESQFTAGMTLENHGRFGWHVDHRRPLASFPDLNDPEQLKAAWHFSNLSPLWWFDNLRKGDKWSGECNPSCPTPVTCVT